MGKAIQMINTRTKGDNAIIIMTKYPKPGRVKTRLIPALGKDGAAALHVRMVWRTIKTVTDFMHASRRNMRLFIFFDGGDAEMMEQWLGCDASYIKQVQGDLGVRMRTAFKTVFSAGARAAVMTGTDCPLLDPPVIKEAFQALESVDTVTGPAHDGGYYLIGLNENRPSLFEDIPWGTDRVLETTLTAARSQGVSIKLLKTLPDIDRPEDLQIRALEINNLPVLHHDCIPKLYVCGE